MDWVKNHQKELRAEKYKVVVDAVAQNRSGVEQVLPTDVGKQTILPATITGTPRWFRSCYFDAMAIVRALGKPSWFITMTCNPKWPEITSQLSNGESAFDRPDLCCRVFHMKQKELLDDLIHKRVLGHVLSYFYTIGNLLMTYIYVQIITHTNVSFAFPEFQKRGLPHMHLLLIMEGEDKPNTAQKSDMVVSAEIPDVNENPRLFQAVTTHMLHGPCGRHNPNSPCMEVKGGNATCTKKFPKGFNQGTRQNGETYPTYRRRSPEDGGNCFVKNVNCVPFTFDNTWVVPYCPYLLLKFDCHINVENVHCLEGEAMDKFYCSIICLN